MYFNDALTDSNYVDWSQEMMNFLFSKKKVGFIDGSIQKPGKYSPDYMLWMRCDAIVKGWLTTTMEKGIRLGVTSVTPLMAHKHQEQEDEEGEERRHPKTSRNPKESFRHVFGALRVLK
uniref:Retrotransposon Copia-like N-terminal domain-containing protein n=1 Tax=Lactuca sativa TaxID=4236 RepID=A0A9R1WVK7_LACSA|nr:hypothetical protein LSAT_V11C800439060 [Lactuca sativa]